MSKTKQRLEHMRTRASFAPGGIVRERLGNWSVLLQLDPNAVEHAGTPMWHLSLKLTSTSSTESDWSLHGAITAAAGCPDPELCSDAPLEAKAPTEVYHYWWMEDGSLPSPELRAAIRQTHDALMQNLRS